MDAAQLKMAVYGALRARHIKQEWWCLTEVPVPGVDDPAGRYIDLFAVHRYTRRRRAVAYEIKVSRADFAREIRHPEKRRAAEAVSTECLFAVPIGMVKPDEVPEGWGLVEVMKGPKCRTSVQPQQRPMPPWPWAVTNGVMRRVEQYTTGLDSEVHYGERWPNVFWRMAGNLLAEEDLLAMTRARYEKEITADKCKMIRNAVDDWKENDKEYLQLLELFKAVNRLTGYTAYQYGSPTAYLQRWVDKHVSVDMPAAVRTILTDLQRLGDRAGRHLPKEGTDVS